MQFSAGIASQAIDMELTLAPAIWRAGRGTGLQARQKRAASNLRSGSHGRAVRGASSALVAPADVHCLAMSGVGRVMVVQYGWGHMLHAATVCIQPLMLTQLTYVPDIAHYSQRAQPLCSRFRLIRAWLPDQASDIERCPVRSKDCITAGFNNHRAAGGAGGAHGE